MENKPLMIPFEEVIGAKPLKQGKYLLIGESGTGKSTLGFQYLSGNQNREERCLFLSLKRKEIRFQPYLSSKEEKNSEYHIHYECFEYGKNYLPADIEKVITKYHPASVVIDDIHVLGQIWSDKEVRAFLKFINQFTGGIMITSLPAAQANVASDLILKLGDLADALLELRYTAVQNQMLLMLQIIKHPGIFQNNGQYCKITDQGIRPIKSESPQPIAQPIKTIITKSTETVSHQVMPEILYFSPLHKQRVTRRIEQFNRQHPGFQVNQPKTSINSMLDYNHLIQQFEEGKTPFACLPVDLYRLPEFAERELIYPLDDFFPESAQQTYIDKAIQQCRYRGKIYAVPHIINVGVLAYRQDLIERAHKTPPTTWMDMMEIIRILRNDPAMAHLDGIGYQGAQFENLSCNLLELILCNGGDIFDSAGHIILNRPEAVEALQFIQDLIHKYHYAPANTPFMMESHCERMFLEGQLVMMRSWPRIISQAELPNSHVSGRVGFVPLPMGPRGRDSVPIVGSFGYVIPRSVSDPEPIWNFLSTLMTEEAMVESATIGWSCPVLKQLYTHPDVLRARPYYRQMQQLIPKGRLRQSIPNYSNLSALLIREGHLVLRNEKTPTDALETIAHELHKAVNPQQHIIPVQKAIEYVYAHIQEQINRDQISQHIGVSSSHFSVLFKDVTGQTFTDYLLHVRIEEARRLLGRPEYNISQISHEVGFNDESYFSYTFKRLTGVTPSHYRTALQGTILSL